ncbi:serine/threonine protein phosphatase [Bifidobacterium coryneforme]|uniref:Ser/Thr protein phosphatase family protein n=1 Tax=Bifidobacterium [indicum] DSM 20214 = LMG 11587 TaxID=1341694 RepID=A0A087VSY8_9BIFI|nr:serine/threonine protein phosphatase [Bifidobacterium indicum]AIC91472.1 Ser/Thr protein phosphatase family protein [Bifidobacterium indicum LMG 11587 = DSM 20214]
MSQHNHLAQVSPGEAGEDDGRPLSVSARLGRLQFHHSGKFRLLQLADVQEGPKVSPDTVKLIAAACDASRPDLVVFTGNQLAGYDTAYERTFRKRRWSTPLDGVYSAGLSMGGALGFGGASVSRTGGSGVNGGSAASNGAVSQAEGSGASGRDADQVRHQELKHTEDLVRRTVELITGPLVERGIPFAVTYGNHDFQCGLDTDQMDAIYREFPGCLNPEATAARPAKPYALRGSVLPDQEAYVCQPGTFALPVADTEGKGRVMGLVLLDSGDYAQSGGYGSPSSQALDFLGAVPGLVGNRSMVFQHMPLPQFYNLLKPVSSTTAYAVQGYRRFDSQCYILDESRTYAGSYLGEGVSCPDEDSGEFDILTRGKGYFALFAGHDHRNGFVGKTDGIVLGATPTCGFGSYGPVPRKRAARLFEFDIRHPHHPRTQLLEFGDLVGRPSSHKVYTFAMSHVPTSTGDAVNLLRRPGFLAGGLTALAGLVASWGSSRRKRP